MDAKSIFLDALEQPPSERGAFVARACGGDAVLEGRVARLLESHRRIEALKAESGSCFPGLPAAGFFKAPLLDENFAPGSRIGAYRLVEEIGDGGFGRVWLSEQEHPVRRRVALKLLKAGLDTREIVARFRAERQALALMDHPHIARVFDGGATERGLPWFAMEYVDGPPITTFCDERRLGLRERLSLFLDACRAVQHAHQKGVIHRDIKPNNVLVGVVDGEPVVKVIDFGIAKAIEQSLTEDTLRTRGDQVIGTPAYMSPEQVERSNDVDTRTDVYSLGVLLYELLAGATPFAEEATGAGASPQRVLRAIREVDPERPSTRLEARRAAPGRPPIGARQVRGDLDWVVMRCLEKNRDRRYDSAALLANDLERHLAGETVLAGPPTVSYRLSKLVRRYRTALLFSAAVFVALIAGIIAATTQASRARAAELHSRTEAEKYQSIAGLLEHILMSIDPADAKGRDTALLREVLDRARDHVEDNPPEWPEAEAAARRVIGGAYLAIARFSDAEPQLERALSLREEALGPESPERLESLEDLGGLYLTWGRTEQAEPLLARCVALRTELLGASDPATIHTQVNLATAHLHLGRLEEAVVELRNLEAWHLERHGELHRSTLLVMNNLALALDRLGRSEEALEYYRRLVGLQTKLAGAEDPRTLIALNNYGAELMELGRHQEAQPLLEEALETKRRILPPGHPSLLIASSTLAHAQIALGRHETAMRLYDEALKEGTKALGAGDRHVLILRFNRAKLLMRLFRHDEALLELEQIVPSIETLEPAGSDLRTSATDALNACRAHTERPPEESDGETGS